jgi:hypothetical protein
MQLLRLAITLMVPIQMVIAFVVDKQFTRLAQQAA